MSAVTTHLDPRPSCSRHSTSGSTRDVSPAEAERIAGDHVVGAETEASHRAGSAGRRRGPAGRGQSDNAADGRAASSSYRSSSIAPGRSGEQVQGDVLEIPVDGALPWRLERHVALVRRHLEHPLPAHPGERHRSAVAHEMEHPQVETRRARHQHAVGRVLGRVHDDFRARDLGHGPVQPAQHLAKGDQVRLAGCGGRHGASSQGSRRRPSTLRQSAIIATESSLPCAAEDLLHDSPPERALGEREPRSHRAGARRARVPTGSEAHQPTRIQGSDPASGRGGCCHSSTSSPRIRPAGGSRSARRAALRRSSEARSPCSGCRSPGCPARPARPRRGARPGVSSISSTAAASRAMVAGRDEERVTPVPKHFAQAVHRGRDDRPAHRHGFEDGQRRSLLDRWEDLHVEHGLQRRDIVAEPREHDAIGDPQGAGFIAVLVEQVAVARDQEANVTPPARAPRRRPGGSR